ncbi:MAG: caspase family protein [Crocinitomicaceae bacterium]
MKKLAFIWLILVSVFANGQIELAVQKGHSADIILLEYSHTGRYLASVGVNNEVIIWDMHHEKSISSFTIHSADTIDGIKFGVDERILHVRSDARYYTYDLIASSLTDIETLEDTNFRRKDFYYHEGTNYEVDIYKGMIRKKRKDKKRHSKYKLAVSYLKASFMAFDVSPNQDMIVGVAEDQMIYVHNFSNGRKKKVLKGHNSEINDVRFSNDGKYFATAGRDRSIIIWDSKTLEIKSRLFSNVFGKRTATFSHDGTRIYIGDELGYIYEIDFLSAFPEIKVAQPNLFPVNKIIPFDDGVNLTYLIASSNNYIYHKKHVFSKEPLAKYEYRDFAILKLKKRVLSSVFHVYHEPFGEPTQLSISPDNKRIVYTGPSDAPNLALADLQTGKVDHLYNYNNWATWTDVAFMSNDHFIASSDSSNVLYNWKIGEKGYQLKTDTLPLMIKNFEPLSEDMIWLNSYKYGQFTYELSSRKLTEISDLDCDQVFYVDKYMVMATKDHDMVFYDLVTNTIFHNFKGHSDQITDINIHPQGRVFISSSNDGTVKLWSLADKSLIATVIPFENKEFIFVMDDNHYLITKGAMEEIGFKNKDQYFHPEQFDLKYNRPDLVLAKLEYTDSSLIKAYHKAYLKRLRKMNFTEEQLSEEFHLPEARITNALDIPDLTDKAEIELDIELSDSKHKLDRLNIWVNEVAILGMQGMSLRDKDTKVFKQRIKVPLSNGKNRIEVSVLNQTGVESYKQQVDVRSTAGKERPGLYLVSMGVSQHQKSEFNLEFAHKDAKDIASTFSKSMYFEYVKTKTLINDDVKLESVAEVKSFLAEADINDVVIVFVAGHGVLDDNFDYFFASYDMDFNDPAKRGIPYENIESLLDGIRARKKLLFIDTCHSGELDKEDIDGTKKTDNTEDGELIFRRVGRTVELKDNPFGLKSTNELMKTLFMDLRRGTGATVISSSGGAEFSIEGGQFKNGLFTYCLMKALTTHEADVNHDHHVSVSELQKYVREKVTVLSEGRQTPTSRLQNNELDYWVW